MNGALKAAWVLTAFVIGTGLALWLGTGRAVFAVFVAVGVLTGLGAWLTGRTGPAAPGRPNSRKDRT